MKCQHIGLIAATLLWLGPRPAIAADLCYNDYVGWEWLPAADSMDDAMMDYWCQSADPQAVAQIYWDSLRLGSRGDHWPDLAGRENAACGQPDTHLIRMLNAAATLDAVWWNLSNRTLPDQPTWAYPWLGAHVAPHSEYSYTVTCNCCDVIASNPSGGDPTRLHYPFFWHSTASQRASTLVHEGVHDWIGHLNDESCPARGSCDRRYGESNAQSWQINFLAHAVSAYWRDPATDELKVARYSDQICGYMPFLSPFNRRRAQITAKTKYNNNFAFYWANQPKPDFLRALPGNDPMWDYGGHAYYVDAFYGARWQCGKICEPADYLPGGVAACDERYQPRNAQINQANFAACEQANDAIAGGVTETEWYQARNEFQVSLEPCLQGIDDEFLYSHCSDLGSRSADVAALEAVWDLPDIPGYFDSGEGLETCTRLYCEGKFDSAWIQPARAACYAWSDDGFGCLDAICGSLETVIAEHGELSPEHFAAIQCRRHYIENDGASESYFSTRERAQGCDKVYVTCRDSEAFAEWVEGQPQSSCNLATPDAGGSGFVPVNIAQYHASALDTVSYLSYAQFAASYPGVEIDACAQEQLMCEALQDALARVVAESILVSQLPVRVTENIDLPRPPRYDTNVNPFTRNMAELVLIATSPTSTDPTALSPSDAVHKLTSVPEMQHAMARAIGRQTFFAVFGSAGRSPIFGAEVAHGYVGAEIETPANMTVAERAAFRRLNVGKKVRERVESQETADLLEQANAMLQHPSLYEFAQSAANAQTPEDLAAALDDLAQILDTQQ